MIRHLHLTADPQAFSVPADLGTQTVAILARKRVGKTYTASVMAEEFCKAKIPFVVLDPTGAWWGLRASADGQGPGFPVVIIGGMHGDVPLEPTAGKVIADLVVEHPGFYVIDLSLTNSNAEQDRFATDFAEQLYRKKSTHPDPLHLFIDEADSFAPQRPFPGQQRMLGAFEAIVRRGGIRGIGVTMITQRASVLNKNVLTQAEVLIALQTTGPQDRAAVQEWVKSHGTKIQQETFMNSLAGLQKGQAWLWSPAWLDVFKLVRIRQRETFNSSATPEVGAQAIEPTRLATVDLDALKAKMAATIEKATADDPKQLRAKIQQLEADLRNIKTAPASKVEPTIRNVPVISEKQIQRLEKVANQALTIIETLGPILSEYGSALASVADNRSVQMPSPRMTSTEVGKFPENLRRAVHATERSQGHTTTRQSKRSHSQQRILNALVWGEGVGLFYMEKTQLALMADQSPTSGGYFNNLGALRTAGLIDYPGPGAVTLTDAGRAQAEPVNVPTTSAELQDRLCEKLSNSQASILRHVIAQHPQEIRKEELAAATGQSPTSGGYFNNLGRLRSLGLIEYPRPGHVVAKSVLFLNK